MKKLSITLTVLLSAILLSAQPPQAFKYQAVVRDAAGGIISNELIEVQISIRDGWGAGTVIYQEIHSVSTNQFGLINLAVGWGTPGSGYVFQNIDWSLNEKFIEVELWDDDLSTYVSMGTSMFFSVPYALYSEDDGDWSKEGDDIIAANTGNVGIGTVNPVCRLDVRTTGFYEVGIYGSSMSSAGVYATTANIASFGIFASGPTTAGNFSGNVHITGSLSKGSGSFLIDHPLDPENKLLRHNFVESPENLLIYRGKAKLNSHGETIIKLPDYFEALTKENEATVVLTSIGKPFLTGYEWETDFKSFTIYGKPEREVSWVVYADRDDPVIHELGRPVEEEKGSDNILCNKGKLLYPKAYGYPESMGRDYEMKQINKSNNKSSNKK